MPKQSKDTEAPTSNAAEETKQLANQSRVLFNELISNVITTRTQLMSQLLDPRRDMNKECGYPEQILTEDYRQMFDREGIGHRVVSVWPEECWSQDPEVFETEGADETEFEAAWKSLQERHNLYHYMQRADQLSGVGRYGVMLLGLSDGKSLDQPVAGIQLTGPRTGERVGSTKSTDDKTDKKAPKGKKEKQLKLLFIRVCDEACVTLGDLETDTSSPRFGRPKSYNINLADPHGATSTTEYETGKTTSVHWTRVIHVADNRESSEIFGTPRMQKVWNRLLDLRKLLGGSAEMFWKGAFPGYSFETNPDQEIDTNLDVESLRQEFAEFTNGLNRFMATQGMTVKSLAPQVADPEKHVLIQIRVLASAIGVPHRVFLGSEQAQLASEQDRTNLDKRVKNRREKYLTPWILRAFIDRLILLGVLPEPVGEEAAIASAEDDMTETGSFAYGVSWPDPYETSPTEQATWAKTIVEAMAQYIMSGAAAILPEQQFLVRILGFDPEEAEAILEEAEDRIADMDDELEDEKARITGKQGPGDKQRAIEEQELRKKEADKQPPPVAKKDDK